jgi:3-oxoacyl-[acyl-carrier-protein] synthase III
MDSSFKIHQSDPEVQQAIQNMRMLSRGEAVASSGSSGRGSSSPTRGSSGGAVADAGPIGENGLPQSLTKDRLKEIMTFNAVMLEKELRPIKEHVERAKRSGAPSQLDPQVLMQVQMRISQAVQQRFGVNDEQVMTAVELYGAKEDPGFKPILRRIASTLSTSLS